ncbi:MAG: acetate--CoA ligase family protein, partial [Methyloligellaceae bacterium]
MAATTLEDLLAPRSVAVIGASDDPSRIGGRPVAYLKSAGFAGEIYPVNPKRDEVQGLRAYPSITDIEGPVDFALITVHVGIALEAARQCAAKGVKTCLLFTSGFAEADDAGARLQDELSEIVRSSDMRVIGPNCLGVFNSGIGFYPTFTNTIDRGFPTPGGYGIATQSGAYGSHIYFLARENRLDVRYWITTGNEADVDVAECIRLLAADENCHVIMAYAEGVKNGASLVEGLELARANRKPVVFMKVGQSPVGAEAASSHTASLAGEDRVYDAVFRQYGVHRARTTEEMIDVAYACRRRIYPTGRRIGLMTVSGGGGVLMADAANEHDLDVAPMPADAQAEIKAMLPYAAPRNPVDVTGQFYNDMDMVTRALRLMLEKGDYDAIIGFFTTVAGSPVVSGRVREVFKAGIAGYEDRLIAMCLIAPDDIVESYEADGFPVFEDPSRAVAAIAALCGFGAAFERAGEAIAEPAKAGGLPEGAMGEREAKAVLRAAGLPLVDDRLAETADVAVAAWQAFGGPVVMKIASPDILHKTEIGGVLLDIASADAAREGFEVLLGRARE